MLENITCPLSCPNTPFLRMHKLLKKKNAGKHFQSPTPTPESCKGLALGWSYHQNSYIRPRSPLPTTVKCLCNTLLNSFQPGDNIMLALQELLFSFKINDNFYLGYIIQQNVQTCHFASQVDIQMGISVGISRAMYTQIDLS